MWFVGAPMGFVGWISWHDQSDDRLEICVFPECVDTALTLGQNYNENTTF
jgi:hypothetical protein